MILSAKKYVGSLLVYFLIGGSAAIVEWVVFATLVLGLDATHYIIGGIVSFVVATYVNFFLSTRYGFKSRGRSARSELVLVYSVSGIGLGVGLATLAVGTELLGIHVMISKIAGTGLAFLWNFAARQFLVFDTAPRWRWVASSGLTPVGDPGPGNQGAGSQGE